MSPRYRQTSANGDIVTAETLNQLREAVQSLIGDRGVRKAAAYAGASESTLYRILRGENVEFETVVRVVTNLGGRVEIRSDR